VITFNFAASHLFAGAGPGDHAGTINLWVQAGLATVAIVALAARTPRLSWVRSVPVTFGAAATSIVTVMACYRATNS